MSSNGFLDINTIQLPKSCALSALSWMFEQGKKGVEGVALWAGVKTENTFVIKRTIIPDQKAGDFDEGLIYVVDGSELYRISLDLFNTGMQLIAQVHSHPHEAYHSETDDEYPMITVLGGISVVVPRFAIGGLDLQEWAVYRYMNNSKWNLLNQEQKTSLFKIIDDE